MPIKCAIFLIFFLASSHLFATPLRMAVTVDDLPLHGLSPNGERRVEIANKILAALKKHGVPEVYGFINGIHMENKAFAAEGMTILKNWVAAGYPLGNHSYSHMSLLRDGPAIKFNADIMKNEALLMTLSSGLEWRVFRYPFLHEGETLHKRKEVRDFLFARGYEIAQVTTDFYDWAWNTPYTRCKNTKKDFEIPKLEKLYLDEAIRSLKNATAVTQSLFHPDFPQILLLHTGAFTAEMIDALLTEYKGQGVKFITLTEAFKDPAYKIDPGVTFKDGALFQDQVMHHRRLTDSQLKITRLPPTHFLKKLEQICR